MQLLDLSENYNNLHREKSDLHFENSDLKMRIAAYNHNDAFYLFDWVSEDCLKDPYVKRAVVHLNDVKVINQNLVEQNVKYSVDVAFLEEKLAAAEAKNKILEEQVDNLTYKNSLLTEELELRDSQALTNTDIDDDTQEDEYCPYYNSDDDTDDEGCEYTDSNDIGGA